MGMFTLLRPGEGVCVSLYFIFAFLLLVTYYILKILREPLLLVESTPEMKSYAYAIIAVTLIIIIPLYGYIFRHTSKSRLTQRLIIFFVINLGVFYVLGKMGFDIGFAYFTWVGIVSLMLTVQFWASAADRFNLKSGERLFPVIMAGATLGGLSGPVIAGGLYAIIGPWNLILIACLLLICTLPFVTASHISVPNASRNKVDLEQPHPHFMGGLAMVFQDRYLFLLAVLMVLLNWVNTTGEYILAGFVVNYAESQVEINPALFKGNLIATFYSQFYFAVNAFTVLIQVLLVARVFKWIGIKGAILILPVIALIGYGLIAFIPIFTIISIVKIAENSIDYSLMNTTRHALYLPLSHSHKFEGKIAIETFFWRLGDLIQAGVIFIGVNWLDFKFQHFAIMNMFLTFFWIWVAFKLGKNYHQASKTIFLNNPPIVNHFLEIQQLNSGQSFEFLLPEDTFTDPDPGDVLRISMRAANDSILPDWISFDTETKVFSGVVPKDESGFVELILTATDFDGDSVSTSVKFQINKQ